MRVIKENKNYGIFPMKVQCRRVVDGYGFAYGSKTDFCGSELEVEIEDIKAHDWEKYPDYKGTDYGVVCPICGKFVVIDEKSLPETVKQNAEKIRLNK